MSQYNKLAGVEAHELRPISPEHNHPDADRTYTSGFERQSQETILRPIASHSGEFAQQKPYTTSLGKPCRKKSIHTKGAVATITSLLVFALAVAAVASNEISWNLGITYQLVVSGFLLSIMSLCLQAVLPGLLLLLEARFGSSTLQNYNGILRWEILAPQLGLLWRMVLVAIFALPIGLSAAYKVFLGGQSSSVVDAPSLVNTESHYGLFGPPGLQPLGTNLGVSLFFNASLPFFVASAPIMNGTTIIDEPPLSNMSKVHGANTLLLSNDSTALLDLPQPDYVAALQASLGQNETYTIAADVFGTVTTRVEDFKSNGSSNSTYIWYCQNSGALAWLDLYNGYYIVLFGYFDSGLQSINYIGFLPEASVKWPPDVPFCSRIGKFFKRYDTARHSCHGRWHISRASIELDYGSCSTEPLPPNKQVMITKSNLGYAHWYMPLLAETVGRFTSDRAESEWLNTSLATAMATMTWSRITALEGPNNFPDPDDPANLWTEYPIFDIGMVYKSKDTAVSHRGTLLKSGWLYLVFGIQPVLTVIVLGLTTLFYSTPIDRGFGLVSILAGIERDSLDILKGASLSGKLRKSVRLNISTSRDVDQIPSVAYRIIPKEQQAFSGRLARRTVYS